MDESLEQRLQPLLDWLEQHVNGHRFLWLLALASFLVAWNRGLDLLYGILALVLAVVVVSWLLPWLAIRSVKVNRRQLGTAEAGGELWLEYQIHSSRPAHHLLLQESMPFAVEQPAAIPLARVFGEFALSHSFRCDQRGVFSLDEITLGSAWPFGFVQLARPVPTASCRLLVTPRTFPIQALPALRTDIDSVDGYNQTARPDINSLFAGVRDYRFGDSLKHIHWSASARHQKLIVREYESHDRPHLLVVVDGRRDADVGKAPWSTFEYALSIAASLIRFAVEQQMGLHLAVGTATPLVLTVPPGARSPDDFVENLAWPRADGSRSYPSQVAEALERFGSINALITLRNRGEDMDLPRVETGHLDIVFEEQSFVNPGQGYRDGWQAGEAGRQTLLIRRNSNLESLFAHDQ